MTTTADRLKELMNENGWKQVDILEKVRPTCEHLHVKIGKSDLSQYVNGKVKPGQTKLTAMGIALNVSEGWLMGLDVPRERTCAAKDNDVNVSRFAEPAIASKSASVRINVLGRVAAGIPIDAVEEIIDWEDIPAEMAKNGEYFGLRIKGDSMSPRIMDGDTVIVRRQDDAETGDIVIAIVNGYDGVCKRLKKSESGIMLISLNPSYDPLVFDHSEIDSIPVSIIGKVVELRGKL